MLRLFQRHGEFLGQALFRLAELTAVGRTQGVFLLANGQGFVNLGQGERVAVVEFLLLGVRADFPLLTGRTAPGADVLEHAFGGGFLAVEHRHGHRPWLRRVRFQRPA